MMLYFWELLLSTVAIFAGIAFVNGSYDAVSYCKLIEREILNSISYPQSSIYNASLASYYSGQESDLEPSCIFSPVDTAQVSKFIKLVTGKDHHPQASQPLRFAIRSGGHMIWSGSANIQGGITVDLRSMNALLLNEDRSVASLGTGGIWSEIYSQLVPYNLTVMGGRVAGIGVGGLSTGGKKSVKKTIRLNYLLTETSL